ncbi:PspC domain-containing protein [Pyxidicoccus parkwayensis]|uniref:PspC domain-containing protein n=1 Tax=Pyxidicoccus parkwayensis TaxID=2813578 RepID=A0ABX7NX11_9BACT|nr:PspC domain-containing protein [Pyxidicoccus parkwaysis]QSQ22971.1 PspC domain-containing protein [Pyxidicoccus parkwaysis]
MDAMKRCTACAEEMRTEALKCPHCGTRTEPLHRGVEGRTLFGVCAALAHYLGLDPALVRVGFLVSLVLSFGTTMLVYLLLWAFTPSSALGKAPMQRTVDWLGSIGNAEESRVETRV